MDLYLCRNIAHRMDSYALLAYAVRRRWGLESLPTMERSQFGKPFFPAFPRYHFNLSHSGTFALCVLDDHPVGADIEVIRPHHPKLARRICSPEELEWVAAQEEEISALCKLWTCKEALVKYHGTGLTVPLRSINPPLSPATEQDGLLFACHRTETFCLCACGQTAPAPLIEVDRKEISP